jgi:protein TonB
MFETAMVDQSSGRGALSFSSSLLLQCGVISGFLAIGLYLPVAQPELPDIRIPAPAPRFREAVRVISTSVVRSVAPSPVRRFTYTPPSATRIATMASIAEPADFTGLPMPNETKSGIPDGIVGGLEVPKVAPPPKPAMPEPVKPEPQARLQIGGSVLASKILQRTQPVYPELARRARIEGVVTLHGIITREGRIGKLRILSGHPLLVKAAFDAVSQWVYSPTLLNGQAVEVEAPIEVRFSLSR